MGLSISNIKKLLIFFQKKKKKKPTLKAFLRSIKKSQATFQSHLQKFCRKKIY